MLVWDEAGRPLNTRFLLRFSTSADGLLATACADWPAGVRLCWGKLPGSHCKLPCRLGDPRLLRLQLLAPMGDAAQSCGTSW